MPNVEEMPRSKQESEQMGIKSEEMTASHKKERKEKSKEWQIKAKETTEFLIEEFRKIKREMPEEEKEATIKIAGDKYRINLVEEYKDGQKTGKILHVWLTGETKKVRREEGVKAERREQIIIDSDGTFEVAELENQKIGDPLRKNYEKSSYVLRNGVLRPESAFDRIKAIKEDLEKKHYSLIHR